MADTAIFYHSHHHSNTKRVLDTIAAQYPVDVFSLPGQIEADFSRYRTFGFASGIYYARFDASLVNFIQSTPELVKGRQCFLIYTSGSDKDSYAKSFSRLLQSNGAHILGVYHCRGFDTFGPFKLLGGIAKGHPDDQDLAEALAFYQDILQKTN